MDRTRWTLVVVAMALGAVSVAAATGTAGWDAAWSRSAHDLAAGPLGMLADAFAAAGSTPVSLMLIGVCVVIALRGRPAALVIAAALAATEIATVALKLVVDRSRPPTAALDGLIDPGFPSGHVARATAICVVVGGVWLAGRTRRVRLAVLLPVTLAMGAARVISGAHYLTDVVGGWLLGLLVGLIVLALWAVGRPRPDRGRASQ